MTASKREQKVSEAPVSTVVITEEEIRESGATSLPDLLRFVPGIDVMTTTLTNFDVSARGMNEISANTMLVLIDGRSVYSDFYGVVRWATLPTAR